MITTRSIDILLRGVRAEFALTIDQAEKQLLAYNSDVYLDASTKTGALFEEINASGRQRVETIPITGISELSPTEEAQPFISKDYVPSFITGVEPFKFTARIQVTREAAERRDSKYQKALNESAKAQIAAENTKARHRMQRFNTAFAAVTLPQLFDYGDGQPLASASHPTKVPGGAAQSNIVTTSDITPSAIEAMILVLQNQLDDIGEPMPMGGGKNYLIANPAKMRRAKQNIDSEWEVGTANNNINVWYGGMWVLVQSPFLTSLTQWQIVDGMFSPLKDIMFRAVTNETWFNEDNKVFNHDISMEHKVGPYDWRGTVFNAGL